ncbi:MAG: glycosyltransferase, partial [Nitrososphaeria archaeon]|nr:glycosyltransferase [Nitrososphaeria archaeon]
GEGQPDVVNSLKKEIKKSGLEQNIDLKGFLEDEDAFRVIKQSRVFIFPSHEEGWGIAICEAMACGLPVVAYDLPVYDEVFFGGLVQIKKGDVESFARKTLELLEGGNGEYTRLSREALQVAAKYNWEQVARDELGLMEQIGDSLALRKKGVLILSPFYAPNVGGVETHLSDLTCCLQRDGYQVFVLTYKPLTSKVKKYLKHEKNGDLEIRRLWWFGNNLFGRFEPYPLLEFLYLTPWLLIYSSVFIFRKRSKIDIIHAHGLTASLIA